MQKKVSSVAVVGGGSAGLLAALGIRKLNPHLKVTVIYSSKVPVIGVGESTQPNLPHYLHNFLELPYAEFYREVRPTWKLGLKFTWGKRPHFNYPFLSQFDQRPSRDLREPGFYCDDSVLYTNVLSAAMDCDRSPLFRNEQGQIGIHLNHAYHIENRKLVAYLMTKLGESGIKTLDAEVEGFEQDKDGFITKARLKGRKPFSADLWVDSSGFESLMLGTKLKVPFVSFRDKLFTEKAVVGTYEYDSPDEPIRPYTCVDTLNYGWCFTIDHDDRSSCGYVYSPDHVSDDEATAEFLKFRPRIKETRIIPFKSGRYEKFWHKNVVGIGNAAGFVEPLEATALALICRACVNLAYILETNDLVTDAMVEQFNMDSANAWDITRDFIALHYAYNNRIDNEFWRECQATLPDKLGYYAPFMAYYKKNGPTSVMTNHFLREGDSFKLDGFLSLAVGMKVPYKKRHKISKAEREKWEQIRKHNQWLGENALTSREAFKVISDPKFPWPQPYLPPQFQHGW